MEIRLAEKEDFDSLINLFRTIDDLHRQNHPERFRLPAWYEDNKKAFLEEVMKDNEQVLMVADKKGHLQGFVHGRISRSPDTPIFVPRKFAVLENIFVDPKSRKKGVGRQLIESFQEWAREEEAEEIELNVFEFNESARAFFGKMGFDNISRRMTKKA